MFLRTRSRGPAAQGPGRGQARSGLARRAKKTAGLATCGRLDHVGLISPRQAKLVLAATAAAGGRIAAARLAARRGTADRRTAARTAAATQLVAEMAETAAAARSTARRLAAARSSAARGLAAAGGSAAAGFAGRSTAGRLATAGSTATAAAVVAAAATATQHTIEHFERIGVRRRRQRETRGQRQDGKGKTNLHGEGSFTNTQGGGIRGNFPLLPGRIDGTLSKALVGQTSFGS